MSPTGHSTELRNDAASDTRLSAANVLRRTLRSSGTTLTPAASNVSDLAGPVPGGPASTPRRSWFTEAELAGALTQTKPRFTRRDPHSSPGGPLPSSSAVVRTTREN